MTQCRSVDGSLSGPLCLDPLEELTPIPEGADPSAIPADHFQLTEPRLILPRGNTTPPPRIFSGDLNRAGRISLSPPETGPASLSRLFYDLTNQLEGLEINASVRIPVTGMGPNGTTIDSWTQATLRDHGAVVVLGVTFMPATASRPLPFWGANILSEIPIIHPFFRFRILRVFMDSETRRLRARIEYLCIPINVTAHQEILEQLHIPPNVRRGSGYDVNSGLPRFAWQMAELVERTLAERERQAAAQRTPVIPAQDLGPRIEPLLEQGEIWVDGNFRNRSLSLLGLNIRFGGQQPGAPQRLRIFGPLLAPVVVVHGIENVELGRGRIHMRLANEGPDPLVFQLTMNPRSRERMPVSIRVPHYRSREMEVEMTSEHDPNQRAILRLEQGFELRNFMLQFRENHPVFSIESLEARQLTFDGFGVRFRTSEGDSAIFENFRVTPEDGDTTVSSQVRGQASGTVDYFQGDERRGYIDFRTLRGEGFFRVAGRTRPETRVEISGQLESRMSVLRLLARSEDLQALAETEIHDARVAGQGTLTIWPFDSHVLVVSESDPVHVEGHAGHVIFHQDPANVPRWPELRRHLGPLADRVQSDLRIQIREIRFDVPRLDLRSSFREASGRSALRINEAEMESIRIRGDMSGRLFLRLGERYYPLVIPPEAVMRDASVDIMGINDRPRGGGEREITFSGITISGSESIPTFSRRDQRRCHGFDRQHLHVRLGNFQFRPGNGNDAQQIQLGQLDSHFHLILRDLLHGGCLGLE